MSDGKMDGTKELAALRKAFPDIWVREDGGFKLERPFCVYWTPGNVESDELVRNDVIYARGVDGRVHMSGEDYGRGDVHMKLSQLVALTNYIQAFEAKRIAALEAPAQPVHPDAELRSVPGAEEESRDHLIDAQTCEAVDPRCSWKAEPAPCTCHPDDAPMECMKRYAASECQAAYSAKYFPIPAEEVPPQTYEDEADLAPEPDALDEPVQDEATTDDLWQQGYNDKLNGFEPSLAEPEYTKGYEARALIEREQASTMEQAKFFGQGMMADADRHQSDQRSIVEKIGGLFKREKEDA